MKQNYGKKMQVKSPRIGKAPTLQIAEEPAKAEEPDHENIDKEQENEPILLAPAIPFDRRRVASMVERVPGGDPLKIIEIIDKYKQGENMPGLLSDGIMSIGETN